MESDVLCQRNHFRHSKKYFKRLHYKDFIFLEIPCWTRIRKQFSPPRIIYVYCILKCLLENMFFCHVNILQTKTGFKIFKKDLINLLRRGHLTPPTPSSGFSPLALLFGCVPFHSDPFFPGMAPSPRCPEMLGTCPKDFSQVAISQEYFHKWQFSKCATSKVCLNLF